MSLLDEIGKDLPKETNVVEHHGVYSPINLSDRIRASRGEGRLESVYEPTLDRHHASAKNLDMKGWTDEQKQIHKMLSQPSEHYSACKVKFIPNPTPDGSNTPNIIANKGTPLNINSKAQQLGY